MPATNIFATNSPVGSVQSSMLTLAQFQTQNGTGWVLADGSNVAGSTYATLTGNSTVPDLRGQVLRGKNNGRADGQQNPDGDVSLGTQQADQFAAHTHFNLNGLGGSNTSGQPFAGSTSGATGSAGGNETRMKNVTVNHFIRIN